MGTAPSDPVATALRVGIDVGGTFTDVVAIEAATHRIVARVKVPTTHDDPLGVARGIVDGLRRVLQSPGVAPERVAFVAHSTTQATNALLEGDVARVGVIGLCTGVWSVATRAQVRFRPVRLAADAVLAPVFAFASGRDDASLEFALDALVSAGCEAFAVSAPFGVDRPAAEAHAVALARARGLAVTSGHDVSSLYGLRARTRTAALNAAILPTMVRTARMTARATREAGIGVPLMIVRSDGGVMDVGEVERRPILTMLSGPAAGIAGALLHERVTDGIFIEVGGTSSDLSVIRRGSPQLRPARIGGHRTMLRTLDVRTLAIAGGSLMRVDPRGTGVGALRDVGPRSAHIAGLRYACFTDPELEARAELTFLRPLAGDPDDYVALVAPDGTRIAATPTCAANLLAYVPPDAFARGDIEAARCAFARIGERVQMDAETLARAVLARAAAKVRTTIEELVRDYDLDATGTELVGGGGAAWALVPFVAETFGFSHRIARDAEVISPLGVALALVRESVERIVPNPTPEAIVSVRREAVERVVAAGADPQFVEVALELDPRRNLVRATASGATVATAAWSSESNRDAAERDPQSAAALVLRAERSTLACAGSTERLAVYLGPPKRGRRDAAIVQADGIVRLVVRDASVTTLRVERVEARLPALLDEAAAFGDVGRALPDCTLIYGGRIAELGGLAEPSQVVALAREELRGLPPDADVVVVLGRQAAA